MEMQNHSLAALFDQLGLGSDDQDIRDFIQTHAPIIGAKELHEASFWNPSQAYFLREAKDEDADWAEVVDRLNIILHQPEQLQLPPF
ncbi:MAG TPA: DUF2789 domain-containing protein [Pseudomonadales bacterium]|nr:DUF2789 domain-containing protein [Pseudomonadales bacterium]